MCSVCLFVPYSGLLLRGLGPGTWDLPCSAVMLAPGHTSSWATKHKETIGSKNSCVHVQVGQILDKRYKETKKSNSHVWGVWSTECWEQNQGTAHTTTWGVGKTPQPRPRPDPWTQPYPHPVQGASLPPAQGLTETCYLFSLSHAAVGPPIKLRLSFLSGL